MYHARRAPLAVLFLFASAWLFAENPRDAAAGPCRADAGWRPLLNGRDLGGWRAQDGRPLQWFTTGAVRWNPLEARPLQGAPEAGGIIVNAPGGRTANLVTGAAFGDVELCLEFLISRGSNSGVYLQGLYEIQIKDSFGVPKPDDHDCGAVYQRWIEGKGTGGTAPRANASRPPGQWQSFHIWFRAPRFSAGRKVENARFLRVLHNGVLVHENVEAPGPTRASMAIPEAPENPIMLQGDHGPVAFRNICVRLLRPPVSK